MPPKVKAVKKKVTQKTTKPITKITKNTKTKELPQHSRVIKRVKRMNPNRIRERSFIVSNDTKVILYVSSHFNDPNASRKIFHTLNIFKKKVSNVDEPDLFTDNNIISFIYENNGILEKTPADKKKAIAAAKEVAESFFTGYSTIEVEDVISLIEEKIARNLLRPQTKANKTRRKDLRRGLKFVNDIIEKKRKEKEKR